MGVWTERTVECHGQGGVDRGREGDGVFNPPDISLQTATRAHGPPSTGIHSCFSFAFTFRSTKD